MRKIVFNPRPALPVENTFGSLKGLPENYKLVCTSDSCFCRSVFEKIVSTYRKLGKIFVYHNSIIFVSPEIASIIEADPSLAPMRY